ncbi:sigma-70 family RNA polymerase sigma factor [Pseudalkalibacillus berkeleyi]|uniref:Sigma-70 family RNA polymerase sigma factor n=1 Tax=Pseudalkalibacillus berkeleyi TaxID=1069813 RepID=A0ABS9H1W8_9BACL|nr:sigma-70 family RNA polymerase sigma factor [Pseudalkalibacillus berkeleyi]MCF6138973.1 sigma-70 family RNA polymerase sigma factor [Pseudalkalibacillus berkeleyi]
MREAKHLLRQIQKQRDLLTAFMDRDEDREDMLQFIHSPTIDGYTELNHRFQQFCFECRFIHYMSKFIYFQTINTIRKLRRNQFQSLPEAFESVVGEDYLMNKFEKSEIECPVLMKGIKNLTDLQQKVIHLHYQKNWKLRRIAEALCVSPQSISKAHRRALNEIRTWMESDQHARGS